MHMSTKRLAKFFRSFSLFGALLVSAAWPSAGHAVTEVDLKLVLATDVSGSINGDEFRLQREGTAQAFLDPDVVKAIQSGALGRIAVTMLDFSSPGLGKVIIDWHIVDDTASATAFAQLILGSPRTQGRRTSVSNAMEMGALQIELSEADIIATRKVIDIAGDGPNNDGNGIGVVREKVLMKGITVNGLPIMDDNANGYYPNLDKYYTACVIGGRASFAIVVHSFRDFGAAMRHKLILEISANEPQFQDAKLTPKEPRLLQRTAAPQGSGVLNAVPAPQILKPTNNEFSRFCDIQGGFGGFNRF